MNYLQIALIISAIFVSVAAWFIVFRPEKIKGKTRWLLIAAFVIYIVLFLIQTYLNYTK